MKRIFSDFSTRLRGDAYRTSRFRDYSGLRPPLAGWLYLPASITTTIAFKYFGYRPQVPWLGYRGVEAISRLLTSESTVLEFGSGMSSVWLARRCKRLISIETNPGWHAKCLELGARHSLTNADFRLVPADDSYPSLDDLPDHCFDFVLVDGVNRLSEARAAIAKVRPGGHIYLDNSDVPNEEHSSAKTLLIEASNGRNGQIFTDFYPTYVGANQGMLVEISKQTGQGLVRY